MTAGAANHTPAPGPGECGGHSPLLLVNPGQDPAYVEAPGRAIGYPKAGPDEIARVRIAPGWRCCTPTG